MEKAFEIVSRVVEILSFCINILSLGILTQAVIEAVVLFYKKSISQSRSVLTKGINTALTFNLAGEVMKMIVLKNLSELVLIGGILVLKVIISTLLHYEEVWHTQKVNNNLKINKNK